MTEPLLNSPLLNILRLPCPSKPVGGASYLMIDHPVDLLNNLYKALMPKTFFGMSSNIVPTEGIVLLRVTKHYIYLFYFSVHPVPVDSDVEVVYVAL